MADELEWNRWSAVIVLSAYYYAFRMAQDCAIHFLSFFLSFFLQLRYFIAYIILKNGALRNAMGIENVFMRIKGFSIQFRFIYLIGSCRYDVFIFDVCRVKLLDRSCNEKEKVLK